MLAEDETEKEAHAPPPPPPHGSKRYIIAPKARQMLLKWESFSDESLKLNEAAGVVQQHMQRGHVLSLPVFKRLRIMNNNLYKIF
jgi:hypothetical protein